MVGANESEVEDASRLMERVRQRDGGAFESLYDAYHRLVYGIALRILGDVPGAEDVTQAVFLKLWSAPSSFANGNFAAWISRVTRNRALDVVRSRSMRQQSDVPDTMPADDALEVRAFAGALIGAMSTAFDPTAGGGLEMDKIKRIADFLEAGMPL